jgi:hypothetical protein
MNGKKIVEEIAKDLEAMLEIRIRAVKVRGILTAF